jgi:hypothetical protein
MEFYEEISAIDLDSHTLQQKLSIHNFPILCRSINTIITDNKMLGLSAQPTAVSGVSSKFTARN